MAGKFRRPPFFLCHAMSGVPRHTWKPSHEHISTVCSQPPWHTCMSCAYRYRETVLHTACFPIPLDYSLPALLTVLSEPSDKAVEYSSLAVTLSLLSRSLSLFFVFTLQYALIFHKDSKLACLHKALFSCV